MFRGPREKPGSGARGPASHEGRQGGEGRMQERVLFSREQIARRVGELAEVLSRDYAGKDLLVVGVLKGAFVFLADLVRRLSIPCEVDFARLASYVSVM